MRRVQAILLVICLLATPLALLARSKACAPAACTKLCCLPHHNPHKASHGDIACPHGFGPLSDCEMKAACNHALQFGLLSPLPPAQLDPARSLLVPKAHSRDLLFRNLALLHGFWPKPLKPPRL